MFIKYFINLSIGVKKKDLFTILKLCLQVAGTAGWRMKTPIVVVPNYATHSDIWEAFGLFCFTSKMFWCPTLVSLRKWLWVFVARGGGHDVGGNILKVASRKNNLVKLNWRLVHSSMVTAMQIWGIFTISSKSHHSVHSHKQEAEGMNLKLYML